MKLIIDIDKQIFDKLTEYGEPLSAGNGFHDAILKAVANGKPIEALKEERTQGKWIEGGKDVTGQYFFDEFICNQCFVVVTDKSNFCPKCGADMRKGGAV